MNEDQKEGLVAAAILGVIILVIVAFAQGWFQEDDETYIVAIGDDPILGEAAPITIIEFSDFSCAYCASFVKDTKPLLMEYIENGMVQFVFKDFPLTQIHPKAAQVAKAAGCAEEQGLFWEYHDLVYENIEEQEMSHLRSYAERAGLNLTEYDSCYASDRRYVEIQRDLQQGRELGVTGTPTFFINGKKHVGYLSPDDLRAIYEGITE